MNRNMGMLVVCCALAAGARAAETAQERGRRVVYAALEALGGDAFLHVEDRVESGRAYSFYREELQGLSIATIYTRYLTPNPGQLAVREREAFGKDESNFLLFTEAGAWEVTFRGARPVADKRFAAYKDGTLRNVFYILRQRLQEPGLDFYSQGSDLYENRPVEIVDITDANGLTVTVFFSQLTRLPERQVFKRRNAEYKDFDTEVSTFANYRDVGGGVKWPMNMRRERNGEKIFEIYSGSVQINKNLKDDLFTLPSKVRMLRQEK